MEFPPMIGSLLFNGSYDALALPTWGLVAPLIWMAHLCLLCFFPQILESASSYFENSPSMPTQPNHKQQIN